MESQEKIKENNQSTEIASMLAAVSIVLLVIVFFLWTRITKTANNAVAQTDEINYLKRIVKEQSKDCIMYQNEINHIDSLYKNGVPYVDQGFQEGSGASDSVSNGTGNIRTFTAARMVPSAEHSNSLSFRIHW